MNDLTFTFNNTDANWNKFNVRPTSLWGDGLTVANETTGTKFTTINKIMLQDPHIVPKTTGQNATVKYGRAGGVSSGTWWETGVKTDGNFHIAQEAETSRGGILFKKDGGIDINQGNNSTITFGPNGKWTGKLVVGAADKSIENKQAQVISTNGKQGKPRYYFIFGESLFTSRKSTTSTRGASTKT